MWVEMSNPAILIEIGRRIKEIRLKKKLQQKELAEMSGISLPSVQRLENGMSVTMDTLISVLRALNILENFEQLLPKLPISPILMKKLKGKTIYRIKKKSNKNE